MLADRLPRLRSLVLQNMPGHGFPLFRFSDHFPGVDVSLLER